MRLSTLVGSAILLGVSCVVAHESHEAHEAHGPSDVLDLTADTFAETVSSKDLLLVEFFAPWCGHCKALAPEYEKAATELKQKNISIAKVDCVDQKEICDGQSVTGYPTLKVFRNGQPSDYSGPRKADGIISYMTKQSLPAISDVTAANHDEFRSSDKLVVVAYLPTSTEAPASAYSAIAEKHRDDYLFGLSTDEAAAIAAGVTPPAIVLWKTFDEGRVELLSKDVGSATEDALAKFITENAMPLLDEISGDTYQTYVQSGLPLAYLFVDPTAEDKQAHLDAAKAVARKHKGALNFGWIDALKYADHAKTLNLKTDSWPGFVIQDMAGNMKYPLNEVPSFAVIDDHVAKYVAKELEPSLKSEAVPESNDGPVTVVVGTEHQKIVEDTDKDVFMEYYAPWCGHCKRLKPIWDELGEKYADVKDKITIAKMDATENDLPPGLPFSVAGFPTIKFKPAGSSEYLDYEGDRSLEDLIAYVQGHAKNDLTPPVKKATETSTQVTPTETPDIDTSSSHEHEEL